MTVLTCHGLLIGPFHAEYTQFLPMFRLMMQDEECRQDQQAFYETILIEMHNRAARNFYEKTDEFWTGLRCLTFSSETKLPVTICCSIIDWSQAAHVAQILGVHSTNPEKVILPDECASLSFPCRQQVASVWLCSWHAPVA